MKITSNAHLQRPFRALAITANKVTNANDRLQCLPEIAGRDCVVLEHTIYDTLSMLSADYDGGFWNYFRLSNGGFYMAPKESRSFRIRCVENSFECNVSANTAGIIATAMAYSDLLFRRRGSCFARAYELLSEFIYQQSDAGTIRAALDLAIGLRAVRHGMDPNE